MKRFVIIPCGGVKLDRPAPARDLYVGSMFRDALRTALQLVDEDHVLILSALHGLVTLDTVLAPYDLKMGQPGSVELETIYQQANQLGLRDAEAICLLPQKYLTEFSLATITIGTESVDIYDGCRGIGDQKARLAQLRRNGIEAWA